MVVHSQYAHYIVVGIQSFNLAAQATWKQKIQLIEQRPIFGPHFRGMNREEWVAPIPGLPCLTGLYEMENSAR